MLKGKTIILGVTGSIAAYKIANLASSLVKLNADVHVIMTKNACNFINPITFETLTSNKCIVDTFDRNFSYNVEHVSLAKKADVFMVAPASANIIAKIRYGICDDMLTTTFLACNCKKIIAPAMNTGMYLNPITQDNINYLINLGYDVLTPATGRLACKDVGVGKMPEVDEILEHILYNATEHDLLNKNILITAGPTIEKIDPVRFITNHSSGKMGYALAYKAALRGANVTLLSGNVDLKPFYKVNKINFESAEDLFNLVKENIKQDIIIMSAAVADYTPNTYSDQKIKKSDSDMSIHLKRTNDILKYLGENKDYYLVGFSMETNNLIENSKAKLLKKNADMICANNLYDEGAGFKVDTNKVTIIKKNDIVELPVLTKNEVADKILDEIIKELK